ncbi:uncharacterized protein LOC128397138 [Panonychus citri]|uniref:uncharacterized protein LOC128397138 n=1 Tax=Panonychus citri TaxID=50023 RepID=UPI0023073E27|nr:uncharacterized protein LOC128397138 [Panonychus citri]
MKMSIRLGEYVSTINKPLSTIVSQLVLMILTILTITSKQVTVHGQFNESQSTINNNETLLINNNIEVTTSKSLTIGSSPTINVNSSGLDDQQLTTSQLDSHYYHVTTPDELLDDVNTQQSTLIAVPPVIRSDYNQQQQQQQSTNLNNSYTRNQTIYKSPITMPNVTTNSSLIHQNNSLITTNQSMIMICDPNRYTFDHQQVAKFFLTTMILLGFCCLLIVILLVLVIYIYRKLSKGRNVKVSSRENNNGANIEIDTIKDGRFYPIQDNPAFDEDEFVGSRTDFRFFEVSSLPYNRNQTNHHQGNKSTTETFGYRH